MKFQTTYKLSLAACIVSLLSLGAITADAVAADNDESELLSQVNVVGDTAAIYSIPGSASFVDVEQIRTFAYDNINRALTRVPGVYLRQEDGYGLFPNISLRGVDNSRSAKVTLMEDGVLAAPAPYASPSAYYSPTTGRMSGIEVLKGTSQIKYGPHTTGGAINYLSTTIPNSERTYLRGYFGDDNEYRGHAIYGNSLQTDAGNFGFVFEGYIRDTDGFKTIDAAPGISDRDDTGFQNLEPMVKFAWEPDTNVYQRFEFKYGFTDAEADETYLGLSTSDFRNDPYRRYSSTQFDNIDREHHRSYFRHFISPTEDFDLITTIYYNKFARNWYKLNDIRSVAGGLTTNLSLSSALAGAAGGEGLECLKGNLACGLRVRANDRVYYSQGVQSEGILRFNTGEMKHTLDVGFRYHNDEEDRFQQNDVYDQAANGAITGVTPGAAGSQADREDEATAYAFYIQDTIEYGDWIFQPGFRYEYLELERRDYGNNFFGDENISMFGGGFSAAYQLTSEWQSFGGINFGFSPPSPGGAIINDLDEETSIGYELGLRYASNDQVLTAEAVGFLTQFDDLIVVNNIGGTGTGLDENFGEVDSYGVELSGQFDLGLARGWSFYNPYYVAFTYTSAEIQNDSTSTDPESIFSFGQEGNDVPYIPEYQITVGTSIEYAKWTANLQATYVDETFTSANNVETETNGVGGPDARFGKTDSYTIVDLSTQYQVNSNVQLFAGVNNLLDDEYIASRQPHGPRPGAPRLWYVGFEVEM